MALRRGLMGLFVAAAVGCAQAHTGLDYTPAATAKVPTPLIRSLKAGVARDVLVELAPMAPSDGGTADAGAYDAGTIDAGRRDAGAIDAGAIDAGRGEAGALDAGAAAADAAVGSQSQSLVRRDPGDLPTSVATSLIDDQMMERASYYNDTQQAIIDSVVDGAEVKLLTRYEHVPFLFVNITTLRGLYAIANRPEVLRLHEDRALEHQLTESLPLINAPAVAAMGKTGANTAVAVLDTGADYTRADFGSCSRAGADGCKVAYAQDFAKDDGKLDDNGHGTNVSAIVLGVAPSTKVLALDVFESTGLAMSSAILAAVDWSIKNRTLYNIVAMNLSLGGGMYNSVCSTDLFAIALANARAVGIVPVVAAGNNKYTGALASPACAPAAVSVGAVYDANVGGLAYSLCSDPSTAANQVACFSNSASFLSLLAPGAPITAGGFRMTGTSQAAPHVAGALAVLRAAFPSEAANASVARLTDSGPAIRDPRNGITKHRLDLLAALKGATATDNTPPTGSVVINGNQAATNSRDVTLAITGTDANGVDSMCISNAGTCTAYESFSTAKQWQLTAGDGLKTVRVALRDAAGNQAVLTDSIRLDTAGPVGGTLKGTAQDKAIALSWSAATDAGSGLSTYRLWVAQNAAPSCGQGSLIFNGPALSFKHTGLTNGTLYGYRLCPVDNAGNFGAGSTLLLRPAPELTPPTGSVAINDGTTVTRAPAVTLNLKASDANGVAQMCVSNDKASCSSWEPFSQTKAWTLSTSKGTTSVYVWYEDSYGNRSKTPVTATVLVDSTPPTGVSLTAAGVAKAINLTWPAASDPSGIAAYTLVFAAGAIGPTSCEEGTKLYEGPNRSYTHTGLLTGMSYSYRLCAVDKAGNRASGVVRTTMAR